MSSEILFASNVLLWAGFIALSALMFGVVRQIGLLHERSAPLGAMMIDHGPDIGERSPVFNVSDFDGTPIAVGSGVKFDKDDFFGGKPTALGPCPIMPLSELARWQEQPTHLQAPAAPPDGTVPSPGRRRQPAGPHRAGRRWGAPAQSWSAPGAHRAA